jgi:hypothetical protein
MFSAGIHGKKDPIAAPHYKTAFFLREIGLFSFVNTVFPLFILYPFFYITS